MIYAADFETTTNPNDCRVWAWGAVPLHSDKFYCGNDIESFISFMQKHGGVYYFHNLKFDGMFITDYLLRSGYTHSQEKKLCRNEFSTLISDMGAWYTMTVQFDYYKAEIRDSHKVLPMRVDQMPAAFDIPLQKLEIDYGADRPAGHEITEEEKRYLYNDCKILAYALEFLIDQGHKKLTTGSNALADFKRRMGGKEYRRRFPEVRPNYL